MLCNTAAFAAPRQRMHILTCLYRLPRRDLFAKEGFSWDYVFDWTMLKYQRAASSGQVGGGDGGAGRVAPPGGDGAGPSARATLTAGPMVPPPVAPPADARGGLDDSRRLDASGKGGNQSRVRRTLAFFTRN